MPLLPAEPCRFPDTLLDDDAPLPPGCWYVLHTRPRAEKALARRFWARQVPFFLPVHPKPWHGRGRTLLAHVPLFPGYVFLRGQPAERLLALETNLVARVLDVPDQAALQADLQRVQRLMASGVPLTPEAMPRPGTPVRIRSGPLAGMEGTVLRCGSQWRLLVEVRFLHQGVSVELDAQALEALPACRPTAAAARN
jgi:transcription antitermination factor NusG